MKKKKKEAVNCYLFTRGKKGDKTGTDTHTDTHTYRLTDKCEDRVCLGLKMYLKPSNIN